MDQPATGRCDVVVVGAGISGLRAAHDCAKSGASTVVLESQNRLGGRILTLTDQPFPVELGAEFIHGRHPALYKLIRDAKLDTTDSDGAMVCLDAHTRQPCLEDQSIDEAFQVLDTIPVRDDTDPPFAQWLSRQSVNPGEAQWLTSYVEGFNASDANRISSASLALQQKAEESIDGEASARINKGYAALVDYLAAEARRYGARIQTDARVTAITWQPRQVTVHYDTSAGPQTIVANRAIVTVPLGVLQSGAIKFSPALPQIEKASAAMSMGFAQRLTCVFRERFWAQPPVSDRNADFARLSFLFLRGADIPVWWTPYPNPAPVLTGWLGGATRERWLEQFASKHRDLTAALRAHALQTLSQAFAIPEQELSRQLIGFHAHNWEHDPHSLGAYSYVNAGGLAASAAFSLPVEDTLFFAGEHTDVEHLWGTVHAAVSSGARAAEQVAKSLKAAQSA